MRYNEIFDLVFMYGDAVVSFSGSDFVWGLPNGEFRTYRFESPDGVNFWFSVDGLVFRQSYQTGRVDTTYLQFGGRGGCIDDQIPDMVNEWDFVRFGTMGSGERLIGSDPPGGFVDARRFAPLDHFTITFDAPNYVYLDEISVETTAAETPIVVQTRRLEDGAPETVEIVLDRPLPPGEHTRFILDDGVIQNVIDYSYILGDADGSGALDLADAAGLLNCFAQDASAPPCAAFDMDASGFVDAPDVGPFADGLTGPR